MRRRWATGLLATVGLALVPAWARAGYGDERGPVGINGSVRTISGTTANYDAPLVFGDNNGADGFASLLGRLVIAGQPWEWLSYDVHAVENLSLSTAAPSSFVTLGGARMASGAYRALHLTWQQSRGDVNASLGLDRLAIKLRLPFADVTVGRQAVSLGKAYFWNPLDVFLAFDATAFDRDYKPGVDGVRVEVPIGDRSGVGVVAAVGDGRATEVLWYRSGVVLRAFTSLAGFDLVLQGGKVLGGFMVGGGTQGELGPVAVRAEAAYRFHEALPASLESRGSADLPSAASVVLGLGHRFESTLDLEAEYFFNGTGRVGLLRGFGLVAQGLALQASQHLLGVVGSYELHPLVHISLAAIGALAHPSVIVQPGLVYSAADEVDLLAGALFAFGERPGGATLFDYGPRSEFGTYPHIIYVEAKIYF